MTTKDKFEPRISLITLGVSDVEVSARFYEKMGFKRSPVSVPDTVVFIPLRGIVLGLFSRTALAEDAGIEPGTPGAFGGITIAYNTRSEGEVDSLVELMTSIGGRLLKAPTKVFWGGYSGYVADPDGHPWEIAFNPDWEVSEDGAMRLPAG